MGVVWEANSTTSGRRVIVKEPLLNHDNDRTKIERLLVEAEILRTINDEMSSKMSNNHSDLICKHAVRYVDQSNDVERPLLVLEFVAGPTLSMVCKGKPLNPDQAAQHTVTLLHVIDALHSDGVLHRDISPSNIILNEQRGLVLIDFGTSTFLSARNWLLKNSDRGRIIFKRGFSAPELLQGHADERSDVFSVGATMFFLLTGKNPADTLSGSRETPLEFPMEFLRHISDGMSEIIEIAMSADPSDRFQSAREMLVAVEAGHVTRRLSPSIHIHGTTYRLRAPVVDIGREHPCNLNCGPQRERGLMQIRISDTEKFIEKHHARIWVRPSGRCFIEDLQSTNRTAVKRPHEKDFKILSPFTKEKLQDNDKIALAYSRNRGPYMIFEFTLEVPK